MVYRQTKSEHRAVPFLADNLYSPSVGLNDCFCDWQAHASSWGSVRLTFASMESVEDLVYLGFLNSWSRVRGTKRDKTIFFLCVNGDWCTGRRIQIGIANNVGKDFSCPS
jgi:hypothetical protein